MMMKGDRTRQRKCLKKTWLNAVKKDMKSFCTSQLPRGCTGLQQTEKEHHRATTQPRFTWKMVAKMMCARLCS